jgi:hypothetical protein
VVAPSGLVDSGQNIACVKRQRRRLCSRGCGWWAGQSRNARNFGPLSSWVSRRRGRDDTNDFGRSAGLAMNLLGGLGGCAAAPAPGSSTYIGTAPINCPAASYLMPGSPAPVSTRAAPTVMPATTAPASAIPAQALPIDVTPASPSPTVYSGSSMPPQTSRAGPRRGHYRPIAGHRRYEDLDEEQLRAQWINPPVGAGE